MTKNLLLGQFLQENFYMKTNNIIPQHVAFIMDGNRRWAKQRKIPVVLGHRKGYQKIEDLVKHARKLGVKNVTFWAFSTENWNREEQEVNDLLNIFRHVLKKSSLDRILKENAKLIIFGDLTPFPKDIQDNVNEVLEESKNNTGITVNIALNYGGRAEILNVVNQIIKKGEKKINEETFSKYLYSHGQIDPDLIIRTGGEIRLSGYLPWQAAYSELYFTDVFWPAFTTKEFDKAVEDFAKRQRRFGK